jgi:hypothetical protein
LFACVLVSVVDRVDSISIELNISFTLVVVTQYIFFCVFFSGLIASRGEYAITMAGVSWVVCCMTTCDLRHFGLWVMRWAA